MKIFAQQCILLIVFNLHEEKLALFFACCIIQAEKLALDLVPAPLKPSNSEISEGVSRSEARNADNIQHYENLVDKLCSELETRKLHWRHYNIGTVIQN